jgi:predicted transcriptional regulator
MASKIQEYLRFIKSYSIESVIILEVNTLYTQEKIQISWKADKEDEWIVLSSGKEVVVTTDSLLKELADRHADLSNLEAQLLSMMCQEAAYYNSILKKIKTILGDEIFDNAIREYDDFLQSVMKIIRELTGSPTEPEARPRLSIVPKKDQ